MDTQEIRRHMEQIIREDGPWTAHDIRLAPDLSTFPSHPDWGADAARRFLQIPSDVCRKPWNELSLLDLGCLEGLYAIEAGLRGARRSVGIDIRPENIRKARFAADVLGLKNVEFLQEDVRGLSAGKHGVFDVIICSGILYHLDVPDVFTLIRRMREMTTGVAVIDTRISLTGDRREIHEGYEYRGCTYEEHPAGLSLQDQLKRGMWASAGNTRSFWFTKPSLFTALARAGFTTVAECHVPYLARNPDRLTLLAIPGVPDPPHAADPAACSPMDWPEA